MTYYNSNILWTKMIPEIWQGTFSPISKIFEEDTCDIFIICDKILFDFDNLSLSYALRIIDDDPIDLYDPNYLNTVYSKTLFQFIQEQLLSGSSKIVLPLLRS